MVNRVPRIWNNLYDTRYLELTDRPLDDVQHELYDVSRGGFLVGLCAAVRLRHCCVGAASGVVDGRLEDGGHSDEAKHQKEQEDIQAKHPPQEHEVG